MFQPIILNIIQLKILILTNRKNNVKTKSATFLLEHSTFQ